MDGDLHQLFVVSGLYKIVSVEYLYFQACYNVNLIPKPIYLYISIFISIMYLCISVCISVYCMCMYYDRCMDGCMDGWADGSMEGWTDGSIDRRIAICMYMDIHLRAHRHARIQGA